MKLPIKKMIPKKEDVKPKLKVVSEKRERFKALAIPRMEFALARIRIVGQLFTSNYEWEESEADKMIATLEEAVAKVKLRANKKSRDTRDSFRL
jgi:hypothetical protein